MCGCSGLLTGNYKGFPLAGLLGKAALTPDLGTTSMVQCLRAVAVKVRTCWSVMLFAYLFPAPAPVFLGLFIWDLGPRLSSGASAEASLRKEEGKT